MSTESDPGVYVREIPSGLQAISGVATSIAAFIGMAKAGPMNTPTTVLGIKDYERVYSDDTSQGEMTEQVRQFFLNGGEQAIISRVANGAQQASVALNAPSGDTVLSLRSRDAGLRANQLRVRIDYNTSAPERSFNLEIFREDFDASGQPQVTESESYSDLSLSPSSARYARTILDQQSRLVIANFNTQNTMEEEARVAALATINGFSASSGIYADAAAAESALLQAVQNSGTVGQFRLRVEGVNSSPTLTISVNAGDTSLDSLLTNINTMLAPHTQVTVAVPTPTNQPLTIQAVDAGHDDAGHDIVIEPAAQFDISAAMGLGVSQGGIEVSAYANARPAPSGLVSVLDDGAGDLAALLALGGADRTTLDSLGVAGTAAVHPITPPVATADIAYPGGGTTFAEGTAGTEPSFRNIAENLRAVAIALSAASDDWRAEVHGHRLALIPRFGSASSGSGATFTSAIPDLTAPGEIFAGVTSSVAAKPLGGGGDGQVAQLQDYQEAFRAIEEQVDIFNIMILPKSAQDTGNPSIRAGVWGAASAFCRAQLAVLLVDVEPTQQTTQGVLDRLTDLRTGVATDHAAAFWPRVLITSNGVTRPIDPSGSVAGVMARIDGSRGVWKASAGVEAVVFGVRGVDVPLSDPQNGQLNPQAINCLRSFPIGVLVWGARTMAGFDNSGQTDYRYLPVRRIALFIEEGLRRGLQFAVFEPNDAPLWGQIRLAAGSFMNGLFRQGAFAGNNSSDAFFVKCDAETTTPSDQALGFVNVAVGFAPLRPAEFVVITLQQKTAQAQI